MRAFLSLLLSIFLLSQAEAQALAPFKDELFAYPAILAEEDGGAYRVVDYDEARDIDARDEIAERRVWSKYVSLKVRKVEKDLAAETPAGRIAHVAVGATDNPTLIVLYIHGKGGSRKQGADDRTFGGNFNRLKNLVVAAGGLYLSPDFSGFDSAGVGEIAGLIAHYSERSAKARVFVACGSMGGAICYGLAQDHDIVEKLGGLLLLGSFADQSVLKSAAVKARVPLFFAHGSADKVFAIQEQEALYRALGAKGSYPVRFVRFETGVHGTPIRMTDWRETLNWMATAR